ncbi:hypothetical protein GCM10023156_44710 [Novipirellula rosea]|uniref:Secreted protein n=1 Tax=Novipirellula rosea TaxID=1031540 RepID=A0ABP8N9C3_9BACT
MDKWIISTGLLLAICLTPLVTGCGSNDTQVIEHPEVQAEQLDEDGVMREPGT